MWKKFALMIVMGMLVVLALPVTTYAALVVSPTDDTWIDLNDQAANKDNSAIVVDYSNGPCQNTRIGYLRFNVAAIYQDVGNPSRLRVYISNPPTTPGGTIALWSTGDDWNGASAGLGDETTLTWNNAPALVASLNAQPIGTSAAWIEFSGAALSNYINSQRSANGGDGQVSFGLQWQGCVDPLFDLGVLEDRENTTLTGNLPELVPLGPLAVTLQSLEAISASGSLTAIFVVSGAIVVALIGVLIFARRRHPRRASLQSVIRHARTACSGRPRFVVEPLYAGGAVGDLIGFDVGAAA